MLIATFCENKRKTQTSKFLKKNRETRSGSDHRITPPVLMPPVEGRPLVMYMTVLENSMGCVLGQHDESGRKEHDIYYLSKKFTHCETTYSLLKKTCYALAWAAHRLRQYMEIGKKSYQMVCSSYKILTN